MDGDGSIELEVVGEGAFELPSTRANRFVAGLEAALEASIGPRPAGIGWRVAMDNAIPLSRGLGSSAAATVGGVVAGAALAELAGATRPDDDALLQIASTIESHPDNAAAVLLGGFVVSAQLADRVAAHPVRRPARPALRAVHPRPAARDRGHAGRAARAGAAPPRRREPGPRRASASLASRRAASSCSPT